MKKRLQERQVTVVPSSTPGYASACSTPGAYSSACSCWGITATTTVAPTPITTTTVTVTATATACSVPDTLCGSSCFNLETDPMNCGACDNVCASGVCDSGSCTNPACAGTVCGSFSFSCSPNSACFCIETTEGSGACATPNNCGEPCSATSDCPADSVCAINTCCGAAGTCTLSVRACEPDVPPSKMMVRNFVNGTQAFAGVWVD
ncbi:hypothetical protein NA56DRAFT_694920 [Hyaloscypha hepaticicola]|uniref:Uncharacterized protein n=1 Tax=Hyaloscypha hepaticicola TaxID=2082293 RepID=A0A2J6PH03_9HELO|nr:hypothetical protein NA56DRAFT_694920 [Hyaloscypha hepaticicola]